MLEIDDRLLEPDGEMRLIENLNRLLNLVDVLETKVEDLTARLEALEG